MKRLFLFVLLIALISMSVFCAGREINVLFIGNSLTYYNNLPGMVSQMGESRHHIMKYEMYTPDGYRLIQHAADKKVFDLLKNKKWDYVVLQDLHHILFLTPEQLRREVYSSAEKLCAAARSANKKAHIVFYMTLAQNRGFKNAPEYATPAKIQGKLNRIYVAMAKDNHALLSPVGMAWAIVRKDQPNMDLYQDEFHPNLTGSYLAACVFYRVIFKESPVGLPYPKEINKKVALYLQRTADKAVAGTKWNWEKK